MYTTTGHYFIVGNNVMNYDVRNIKLSVDKTKSKTSTT